MTSESNNVFIIAEAGVNHNGSLELALRMVDTAADAGADAVKFQMFQAEKLVSVNAPKAPYQEKATGSEESQLSMLRNLELSEQAFEAIAKQCKKRKIEFLSTPFDQEKITFLTNRLGVKRIKLSSGDITDAPLLLSAAQSGKPIILSTGMSTLDEIERALGILAFGYLHTDRSRPSLNEFKTAYRSKKGKEVLRRNLTLLHCTSEYPAPFAEINLRALVSLKQALGLETGLSDHSKGSAVSIAAVALGARVIEKHFTLDRDFHGPDHKASLQPDELKLMVRSIRDIQVAMGSDAKRPSPSEYNNRDIVRKSLVAACAIKKGEAFTENNLTTKRPGTGVSPICYWEVLGKNATRDYAPDELIAQ